MPIVPTVVSGCVVRYYFLCFRSISVDSFGTHVVVHSTPDAIVIPVRTLNCVKKNGNITPIWTQMFCDEKRKYYYLRLASRVKLKYKQK